MKILTILKSALFLDGPTKAFMRHNRKSWREAPSSRQAGEILVELFPVAQTVISFAYFANALAERHRSRIVSISTSERNGFLYKLRHRSIYSVYKSFGTADHVNSSARSLDLDSRVTREYRRIRKALGSKQDVFAIEVEGCPIGCDLYESFLYDYMKPTIDTESADFDAHLRGCLRFFYYWKDYIESHRVKAVVLSHGLYKYGILKRICVKQGIPVYLPTARSMVYIREMEDLGNPRFESYREYFRSLPMETREGGLRWAKTQLGRRLSGEVGVDMHYATKSAYAKTAIGGRVLEDSPRLKVLIATHCFFDNPHAYGVNLFPDFYEWLEFLGKMSNETGYDWYLKTHPDVLPGNDEILGGILSRYPRIRKIPSSVSHHQLCEEGISVVLTTYGSVGHEYPMLGKQVVNAGLNPHVAYNFNHHPKSVEEYREILLNLERLESRANPDDLYEFYFVHYKCNTCDKLVFESYSDFTAKLTTEQQNSPEAYRYFLEHSGDAHHRSLVRKIGDFLESGEYRYFEPEYAISGPAEVDSAPGPAGRVPTPATPSPA